MSDEYLWDRSGFPEPDELELEALLAPLGLRASAPAVGSTAAKTVAAPAVSRPGGRVAAAVFAAAACIALGWWLGGRQSDGQAIVADSRDPANSDPMVAATGHDESRPPVPAGPGRARDELIDPWKNAPSRSPRSEVIDPWSSAPTAWPRSRPARRNAPGLTGEGPEETGLIDPWSREASRPPAAATAAAPKVPANRGPRNEIIDPWRSTLRPTETETGAGLSPPAVQRVVSEKRRSLVASCWVPAVERSAPDAPRTARVQVELVIANDGRVTRAAHGGEPEGYSGLAQCLATEMSRWIFPKIDEPATVTIPFVFTRD